MSVEAVRESNSGRVQSWSHQTCGSSFASLRSPSAAIQSIVQHSTSVDSLPSPSASGSSSLNGSSTDTAQSIARCAQRRGGKKRELRFRGHRSFWPTLATYRSVPRVLHPAPSSILPMHNAASSRSSFSPASTPSTEVTTARLGTVQPSSVARSNNLYSISTRQHAVASCGRSCCRR